MTSIRTTNTKKGFPRKTLASYLLSPSPSPSSYPRNASESRWNRPQIRGRPSVSTGAPTLIGDPINLSSAPNHRYSRHLTVILQHRHAVNDFRILIYRVVSLCPPKGMARQARVNASEATNQPNSLQYAGKTSAVGVLSGWEWK